MRYGEKCRLLKAEWDGYSDARCRTCAPILSDHHSIYYLKIGFCHPFREPLQCIVIAVMSVTSGTFPYTYGVST